MGIKIPITKEQLPLKYQKYNLIETTDGITHSVYLLDDVYVLKIFNTIEYSQIKNEIQLLKSIKSLPVPRVIESLKINDLYIIVYSQIIGNSVINTKNIHIKQIGLFLKKFHLKTKGISSSNIRLYDNNRLKDLIEQTNNNLFINEFNKINIKIKNDGIIHGDLFKDNAKFQNDRLSGVYDFSEACNGDYTFELSVVAISWCFDDNILNTNKLSTLLNSYDINMKNINILSYIRYALLYYATTRYLTNNNYQELLNKLKEV